MWTVFVSLTSPLWIREHLDTLWGVIVAQVFQLSPHQLTPSEESGRGKGGQDEFFSSEIIYFISSSAKKIGFGD